MSRDTKQFAAEAKHCLTLSRFGTLSTISLKEAGYPFGSIVPYDLDPDFNFIIYVSLIAEHYKNLKADPRASLLVFDPFGVEDPQAHWRASVLMKFEPVPESDSAAVQARYETRFPGSINYEIAHNFLFMRGYPEKLRWIGGFGEIGWIDGKLLAEGEFDEVAYVGHQVLAHMNQDHQHNLVEYLKAFCDCDPGTQAVQMVDISKDGFGIAVGCGEGKRIKQVSFPTPLKNAAQARSAMIELSKNARLKLQQ